MSKKIRNLGRLILSSVLLAAAMALPLEGWPRLICFLVPYSVVGYDVLWAAARNIVRGQVFDENFLMALATVAVRHMRGGLPTATTYIKPYKKVADKSAVQTMEERFAYGLNPEKLGAVSSYLCDPATAHAEFLLTKSQYQAETGRAVERGALFFQIRQAFPQGEAMPEEANKIGYETAMRWTKGKYQFFVCTHIDKGHIHNHIYYCSTAYDRSRKYHNFIGSAFALRRLSDRVCIEHDLSYIQNPAQHSKGKFLHYGQWLGTDRPLSYQERLRLVIAEALEKGPADFDDFLRLMEKSGYEVRHGRGEVISFVAPGQERATRLRTSTLGDGYDPEDIRAVIAARVPRRSSRQNRQQRPSASILLSTFRSGFRARARPMSGGPKSTTSNRWPPPCNSYRSIS